LALKVSEMTSNAAAVKTSKNFIAGINQTSAPIISRFNCHYISNDFYFLFIINNNFLPVGHSFRSSYDIYHTFVLVSYN